MHAGARNRRLVIERNTAGADDAFGEAAESWSVFIEVWASREDVRDSEKVATGQVQGSLLARFGILSSSESRTITTKDRMVHDGKTWQILGIKQVRGPRDMGLEITAATSID